MYEREVLQDRPQGHSQPVPRTHLAEQLLQSALVDDYHRNVYRLLYACTYACMYVCMHVHTRAPLAPLDMWARVRIVSPHAA